MWTDELLCGLMNCNPGVLQKNWKAAHYNETNKTCHFLIRSLYVGLIVCLICDLSFAFKSLCLQCWCVSIWAVVLIIQMGHTVKMLLVKRDSIPCCPGKRHPVLAQPATRKLGIFQDLLCHLVEKQQHRVILWLQRVSALQQCNIFSMLPVSTHIHMDQPW